MKKTTKHVNKTPSSNNYILLILVSIIVILLAILSALIINPGDNEIPTSEELVEVEEVKRLKYWTVILEVWHEAGHFRTMERVFNNLQYKFVNASHGDDWDILWSIENPFYLPGSDNDPLFVDIDRNPLRQEQKINHFPGIGILAGKSYMNRNNAHLPYILPSFVLPKDKKGLQEFFHNHPNAKLIEKHIFNRGVTIIEKKDILYERSDYFYQQFMDKPFLIDGYAFDFGVFVLITSFDPIRIYRFDADVLFRFCKEKYLPFDPLVQDKYVVQANSHPPFDMPTFEKTYENFKFPIVKHFEKLVTEKGFDVNEMWTKIDDAIVKIIHNSEDYVLETTKSFNCSTHHFFELVRFDFILDEKLTPYVMEVNMSPNLTPVKKRYEENAKIYEQLIFDTVKMIGGGSYFEFMTRFNDSDVMIANKKNLAVDIESCLKYECHKSCEHSRCKLCLPCVNAENRHHLREAFREHNYEANFRRLYPAEKFYNDEKIYEKMTNNNKISLKWFGEKCLEDERWC